MRRVRAMADGRRMTKEQRELRRRTRWVLIEMERKHGRVELESGRTVRRDCRICRMLAEAPGRERRAA